MSIKIATQNDEMFKEQSYLNKLLMDSLPHSAMLINKDRIILASNKIASQMGSKFGDYCWRSFGKCEYIHEKDKKYIKEFKKIPLGGTQCNFCLA